MTTITGITEFSLNSRTHTNGAMGLKVRGAIKTIKNNKSHPVCVIAIPSYKRATLIYKKTLSTLARHFSKKQEVMVPIYVFLANNDELQEYKNAWPPNFPLDKADVEFVIGEKGLKNQRNFIMDYFPECTNIVQMDDDIDDVLELVVPKTSSNTKIHDNRPNRNYKLRSIKDLLQFFTSAFSKCRAVGSNIWGIYPVPNAYFMTPTQTTDLRFIVGPMFGVINRHDTQLKLTTDEKENVERTLQYFTLDGRVLRYNNITVQTKYFKTMGGMQASLHTNARRANAEKAAMYLHALYPDLTQINLAKKSGWPEIKFIAPHHSYQSKKTHKRIKKIHLTHGINSLNGINNIINHTTRKKTRNN